MGVFFHERPQFLMDDLGVPTILRNPQITPL